MLHGVYLVQEDQITIGQLVAYVGLEEFLAGLRDYFRDHAFGNATFGDLLGALEKASGRRNAVPWAGSPMKGRNT